MRLTAGKIYFWGAFIIITMTVWNRMSTRSLRVVVDNIKEERMAEADRLRSYQGGEKRVLSTEERAKELMAHNAPKFYNPHYQQQQQEGQAINHAPK